MNKELITKYIDIVMSETWGNDPGMEKHYKKNIDTVVELSDGSLIAINKPSIETNFCFGYHDSRYDTEDFDRANDMARHARTNEDYFRSENLKRLDGIIKDLRTANGNVAIRTAYIGAPADSKIKYYSILDNFNLIKFRDGLLPEFSMIDSDDVDKIITAYEDVRSRFVKRLDTYLKRYGLSKVRSWSYWLDA